MDEVSYCDNCTLHIMPCFCGSSRERWNVCKHYSNEGCLRRFSSGDMEAWKAEHDADVVWTILEGLPYAGTYEGTDTIIENVFSNISALWPDFKVEPIEFFESGDKVFIHVKITIAGKETEALHMATMKDGKQVAFTPFENSAFMMQQLK